MKNIILLSACLLILSQGFAQNKTLMDEPRVDRRTELVSIVFRLAGSREYNMNLFKLYTDKIDDYFSPYKDHELIKFASNLYNEKGIGYNAVVAMGVYLDEDLNPRVDFAKSTPEYRWNKEDSDEFVRLLKKFNADADYKRFFDENENFYKEAGERFMSVFKNLDLDWYSKFYGKEPSEKFIVINGLNNGGANYGVSYDSPKEQKEVYAIMGAWTVDSLGMAVFNMNDYFPTLVHEFNHSFVNYLLDTNPEPFKESGKRIFQVVGDKMKKQAYGEWTTVLNEALVRAAVIKYMKDHDFSKAEIEKEINYQQGRGFIWIKELVEELEVYDSKRDIYPTLESYIPELSKAYKTFADNVENQGLDKK